MPVVREFARLTVEHAPASLDRATIPLTAFHWLAENASGGSSSAKIVSLEGPRTLRVLNYVGVIDTPCGTQIEILPKYTEADENIEDARRLLATMVEEALQLKPREGSFSQVSTFKRPLPEWLAARFLQELSDLLHRGLRRSYRRVEAREPVVRGSLDIVRQVRSGPASAHLLSFQHDIFCFDRPENRLLRSTLEVVVRSTRSPDNWRLARELATTMAEVPESIDITQDFSRWSDDRLMADYAGIKAISELILLRRTPFSVAGTHRGLSMLFPMERLFELYVLRSLRKVAPASIEIRAQSGEKYLCSHDSSGWFRLRPDITVTSGVKKWIIDTKWKLLSDNPSKQHELSQSDFYQLFAYGHKYLGGDGEVMLVYPRTTKFKQSLAPFDFSPQLRLHVLAFDLSERKAPYPFLIKE